MAANTAIYTGADGSLTLSVPQGKEGDTAQALVLGPYDLINVGRVEDVHVEVKSEIHVFNEIGKRYPTQLRAGNITITGSIGRAYINGALLKLLLGEAAAGTAGRRLPAAVVQHDAAARERGRARRAQHRDAPRRQDRELDVRPAAGRRRPRARRVPRPVHRRARTSRQ